jgi:CRP/FNR family transcriptional regulator, cyclic AMP receptor protein
MHAPGPTLLDSIPDPHRSRLLNYSFWRTLDKDERLFNGGDRTNRAFLLMSGIMKLGARAVDGKDAILYLAFPGELVGDVGVLDGLPQPHEAIASTECQVLGMNGDVLNDVLESVPQAGAEVARCFARRLRWISDSSLERQSGEVPARLAGRILDLADVLGVVNGSAVEMELPLHQRDLGRLAGMCRESACKAMSAMRKQGVIDYKGQNLRILRPDVLERIRCAGRV